MSARISVPPDLEATFGEAVEAAIKDLKRQGHSKAYICERSFEIKDSRNALADSLRTRGFIAVQSKTMDQCAQLPNEQGARECKGSSPPEAPPGRGATPSTQADPTAPACQGLGCELRRPACGI